MAGVMFKVKCLSCGEKMQTNIVPKFCPNCGSPEIEVDVGKARITSERWMAQLDALKPEVDRRWDAYIEKRGEYEEILCKLRPYTRRGVVGTDELNKYQRNERQSLTESLKKARKNRVVG